MSTSHSFCCGSVLHANILRQHIVYFCLFTLCNWYMFCRLLKKKTETALWVHGLSPSQSVLVFTYTRDSIVWIRNICSFFYFDAGCRDQVFITESTPVPRDENSVVSGEVNLGTKAHSEDCCWPHSAVLTSHTFKGIWMESLCVCHASKTKQSNPRHCECILGFWHWWDNWERVNEDIWERKLK